MVKHPLTHLPLVPHICVSELGLVAFRLFPPTTPLISCHWVLRVSLHKCASLVNCVERLAHAQHVSLQPVLLSMLSGEIYLRLKPYLVVKISPDRVTEHCCQVCVLSMMFCCSDCQQCADMVSDCAIRETRRRTMWFDLTPAGQRGI